MSSKDAHRIAVHEAGHAIAAVLLGVPLEYVTTVAADWSGGHVLCRLNDRQAGFLAFGKDWYGEDPEFVPFIEAYVQMTLAGAIAEADICGPRTVPLVNPMLLDPASPERQDFETKLRANGGIPEPGDKELAHDAARAMFRENAAEIGGGEDPQKIESFLEEMRVRAREFVTRPDVRRGIEAVAQELETMPRIGAERVHALLEEAHDGST